MAFDAGMVCAVANELNTALNGAKIEKVFMPEKDEIHFLVHSGRESRRLLISASSSNPRILITDKTKENPPSPPMLCMQLRKHLTGGRIVRVEQIDFERVIRIEIECYDELGFLTKRNIYFEIMGKHSNIIFCDANDKILNAVRPVDFSVSLLRQILPGIKYELPPKQNKANPLEASKEVFFTAFTEYPQDRPAEKFITDTYLGISSLIAREIVFRSCGNSSAILSLCSSDKLWFYFTDIINIIRTKEFSPTILFKTADSTAPFEYAFCAIRQYGSAALVKSADNFSSLLDEFFSTRDKNDRIKQRSQDIFHLLCNTQNRLLKKIELQQAEISDCSDMEQVKLYGDLITQNIYAIKRGDSIAKCINYFEEACPTLDIPLDVQLSPSQNAQKYYKAYNKKKSAKSILAGQLENARKELEYIDTVFDALTRAQSERDLDEIREELSCWGYAKRIRSNLKMAQKPKKVVITEFTSPNGYKVLMGKNNVQNDYLTTQLAEKSDYWFHVKDFPGSHVVLCTNDEEPPAEDFTFAAALAAENSKAKGGVNIAVDYAFIRNVKKPAGSKPGYVIYDNYWTAYVTPSKVLGN
ncbi:MAG: fibronectin/fibrinogen-binding protein [Ruminococcaceae bacterium]|nr:fibronectin/fibrinogen-binding protein [Oscillospiraceae bacterium]